MRGPYRESEPVETPPHRAKLGFSALLGTLSPHAGRGAPRPRTLVVPAIRKRLTVPKSTCISAIFGYLVLCGDSSLSHDIASRPASMSRESTGCGGAKAGADPACWLTALRAGVWQLRRNFSDSHAS
jgi:hypothetical protein